MIKAVLVLYDVCMALNIIPEAASENVHDESLSHNRLAESILDVIKPYRLLEHPFYTRWQNGELQMEELAYYASQYRLFERYLPSFLLRLTACLPEGEARDLVLANLADEEGDPVAHIDLFERFANAVGAQSLPTCDSMADVIVTHEKLLEKDPTAALAGFLAYEIQSAEIAKSKSKGLKENYGISNFGASFWTHHATLEEDHAAWTLRAVSLLEEDESVILSAVEEVAKAWWSFLDEQDAYLAKTA